MFVTHTPYLYQPTQVFLDLLSPSLLSLSSVFSIMSIEVAEPGYIVCLNLFLVQKQDQSEKLFSFSSVNLLFLFLPACWSYFYSLDTETGNRF